MKANYDEKLYIINKTQGKLGTERLSPPMLWKNYSVKSLTVSQLTYILSALPTNQCAIDEVNTLFFKTLW